MQAEKILGMWFVGGQELPAGLYEGSYDLALVVISYGMAFFASYVGLMTVPLIASARSFKRLFWLFMGAVAMGGGVWSMHFIGMLAFRLPFEVGYNGLLTLISVFPGILGSAAALFGIAYQRFSRARLLLSGVCLALGIGSMHFIGMAAMHADAAMIHEIGTFLWSIVIAFALALSALYLEAKLKTVNHSFFLRIRTAVIAAIVAAAVSGMHYTAMESAYFYDGPSHMHGSGWVIHGDMIVVILNLFVFLLIGFVLFAIMGMSTLSDASLLRNIFMESSDGLMVVDHHGRITLFSPASEKILGYSAQEVLGTSMSRFLPDAVQLDHREYLKSFRHTDMQSIMGKDREVVAIHKQGHAVPVEVNVSPLKAASEGGYSLSLRDVTQRKADQLELVKLHQAIEQSPISVIITDIGGMIEYVNPQFTRITGYQEDEVIGRNPRFLNTGQTSTDEYDLMWTRLNDGKV